MAVTLKDIAKVAGINASTASRCLSGFQGVNEGTRQKVLQVAADLNYRPNRVARGLVTGRSHTIALLISDIRNPFFAEVARGAEDAAHAAGCDLILCNSDFDTDKQLAYLRSLSEKRVDGILMNSVASLRREQLKKLTDLRIPIVLLNKPAVRTEFCTVCADNYEGGRLAGSHLAQLGHRTIAHLTGPKYHGNLTERVRGFVAALKSARVPPPLIFYGQNSFAGGYDLAHTVFGKHPEVTAIFVGNDAMAFGVGLAAAELNLQIPRDVSLIGFDDVDFAQVVNPPLTTIHAPKYEIGEVAVETLLKLVQRGAGRPAGQRILGVELIIRKSCGPPPATSRRGGATMPLAIRSLLESK
jgi:LacI family transcriptional regulator